MALTWINRLLKPRCTCHRQGVGPTYHATHCPIWQAWVDSQKALAAATEIKR